MFRRPCDAGSPKPEAGSAIPDYAIATNGWLLWHGAKALGQILPWRASTQNPQNPVDDRAMLPSRSFDPRLLCRQ